MRDVSLCADINISDVHCLLWRILPRRRWPLVGFGASNLLPCLSLSPPPRLQSKGFFVGILSVANMQGSRRSAFATAIPVMVIIQKS